MLNWHKMMAKGGAASYSYPRTGLIGEWLWTGGSFADTAGSNDGTNVGTTGVADRHGIANNARSFSSNYIALGTDIFSNADISTGCMNTWFKPNSLAAQASVVGIEGVAWIARYDPSGTANYWKASIFDGSSTVIEGNAIVDATYIMLTLRWDGTNLDLFENGQPTATGLNGSPTPDSFSRPSDVGRQALWASSGYANGVNDEFLIWGASAPAFSNQDILDMYNGTKP